MSRFGSMGSFRMATSEQSVQGMSLGDIQSNLELEPATALAKVVGVAAEFRQWLSSSKFTDGDLKSTLQLIVHCLKARDHKAVITLLSIVNQSLGFIQCLAQFLAKSQPEEVIIDQVLCVCESFSQYLQGSSGANTTILIYQIDVATQKGKSEKLQPILESLKRNKIVKKSATATKYDYEDDWVPEKDFRAMTIAPTHQDLFSEEPPFLRKNKVDGTYQSVHHYLDVQFRLLREDSIGPLREAIQELLKFRETGVESQSLSFIWTYECVHFSFPVCTKTGIVYQLQLDLSRMKNVNLQQSKRLMFGSLVCLTPDNFKTIIIGTVEREICDLERGVVFIRVEEHSLIDCSRSYEMVENPAFSEAYKHNLKKIQEIDDIPFEQFLLGAEVENISPPRYLQDAMLDFSTLTGKKESTTSRENQGMMIPALQLDKWPSPDAVGLNRSQYEAFQNALTKEVSLIQGPPGTGKTYLGLKIMKVLLDKMSTWQTQRSCILVVCYTNHALDQFLEAIIEQAKLPPGKLVRLGGNSGSEKVKNCTLYSLRRELRFRSNERYLNQEMNEESRRRMRSTESKMESRVIDLEIKRRLLTPLAGLKFVISNEHLASFESVAKKYDCVIGSWLLMEDKGYIASQEREQRHQEYTCDIQIDHLKRMAMASKVLQMEATINKMTEQTSNVQEAQVKRGRRPDLDRLLDGHLEVMSLSEAKKVKDVWTLKQEDRFRLYRLWQATICKSKQLDVERLCKEFDAQSSQLSNTQNSDIFLIQNALVVGATTTGVAKNRELLRSIRPTVIIVEEAAEVVEAHILTALSTQCQHLILIGDHQQLRPNTASYKLAKKYNLDVSLFERMVKRGVSCCQLDEQHRMRPEISNLITPHIYKTLNNHPSVLTYEDVRGIKGNLFFINHNQKEGNSGHSSSHSNEHEAEYLARLLQYLFDQDYKPSQVTILTMYKGQVKLLEKKTKHLTPGFKVTTVDNFQGEENDIILLSCVRSNDEDSVGFLKISNRICVALSRARIGLFGIGNMNLLRASSEVWDQICRTMEREGQIVDALPLGCRIHPQNEFQPKTADDFDRVPNGGCSEDCKFRLKCGHACGLKCHTNDPCHKNYKCVKSCASKCGYGHTCSAFCHAESKCPLCQVLCQKTMPKCNHVQMVPCHMDVKDFSCQMPCGKILACSHLCPESCGRCLVKQCPPCKIPSAKQKTCGHQVSTACSDTPDSTLCDDKIVVVPRSCPDQHGIETSCKRQSLAKILQCSHQKEKQCPVNPAHRFNVQCHDFHVAKCDCLCDATLPCGHSCQGRCSNCANGQHSPCNQETYKRSLPCGHFSVLRCGELDLSCSHMCERSCSHTKCLNECSEPCSQCTEQCYWGCQHDTCDLECWEPCTRAACDAECPLSLPCGHPCCGLCGEKCPQICRECHSDFYNMITKDKESRLVMLSPCLDVFPVNILDEEMDKWRTECHPIQPLRCPICSTTIKSCNRYNAIIKTSAINIDRAKVKLRNEKQQREREAILSETMLTPLHQDNEEVSLETLGALASYRLGYGIGRKTTIGDQKQKLQSLIEKWRTNPKMEMKQLIETFKMLKRRESMVRDRNDDLLRELCALFQLPLPSEDAMKSGIWMTCPDGHIWMGIEGSTPNCPDCRLLKLLPLADTLESMLPSLHQSANIEDDSA